MLTAPQQDWSLYRAMTEPSAAAWDRALTPQARFEIYADLFDFLHEARRGRGDWARLEQWEWDQKLAIRLRVVDALRRLDQHRHERSAAGHGE